MRCSATVFTRNRRAFALHPREQNKASRLNPLRELPQEGPAQRLNEGATIGLYPLRDVKQGDTVNGDDFMKLEDRIAQLETDAHHTMTIIREGTKLLEDRIEELETWKKRFKHRIVNLENAGLVTAE